ncbi:MAG TPA: thioesterase family protein [Candidatus Binatia bacterium]|nr:thioesterase family protein [Candidatus Binatia bacterium]
MSERLRETTVDLEVPFHDVDSLGIVWHGHYYKYLEVARTRLLRSCGLDKGDVIGPRYRFLVVESRCRYAWPLQYGDHVRVAAWFGDLRHRIRIAYEVTNLTAGRRSARAHTVLATTDLEGRLLLETPDRIIRRIQDDAAAAGSVRANAAAARNVDGAAAGNVDGEPAAGRSVDGEPAAGRTVDGDG